MRKMKCVMFMLVVIICMILLLNTKVDASEDKYVDIMNSIPSEIEVNDSASESVEEKIMKIKVPEEYELIILSNDNYWSVNIGLKLKSESKDEYLAQKAITVNHTCDLLEKILEILPNEIRIDLSEIEYSNYEKADKLVENEINNFLQQKDIMPEDLEENNIEIQSFIKSLYIEDGVKTAWVGINYNGRVLKKGERSIKVVYNNSNQFNKDDEAYIKNLRITKKRYYEVNLGYLSELENQLKGEEIWSDFFCRIEEEYKKQIGDNNLTIKAESGAIGLDGGLNLWTGESGTHIGIFKNDILYDIRCMGNECTVPVINVPSTIATADINNYVINEIIKYYPEFGNNIYEISEGTGDMDIIDGYTVKSSKGKDSYIIIRKNTKTVLKDVKTNVKLEAMVEYLSEDTELLVKQIVEGEEYNNIKEQLKNKSKKFDIYDISLVKNNTKIQPSGKVKVYIPIPDSYDYDRMIVYRIKENGLEEYNVEIEEGFAIFETEYFSTYVLAEKELEEISGEQNEELNLAHKLDDTPKTGENDISTKVCYILSMISTVGIMIIKRV